MKKHRIGLSLQNIKLLIARLLLLMSLMMWAIGLPGCGGGGTVINGAGATFPYPIYSQWASKYHHLTGMRLNYQSIGSGGGIAQIIAGTVDFGATDAPLTKEELDENGLLQFPMIVGGIVPVVHIQGIESMELKLTPEVLVDIFLGKITQWNDERLKRINPSLALPETDITVVHRAEGSGTTWIFTNYLCKVSPEWNDKIGTGKTVNWPVGVGGKGNEGVANYVLQINGAIGYVEFAYTRQSNLSAVQLANSTGNFVQPAIETFQAAAGNANWTASPGFYVILTDQPGENTWPITGASFILLHKEMENYDKAKAMLNFFNWCYQHGKSVAVELHYVPLPESVIPIIENNWEQELTANNQSVWP